MCQAAGTETTPNIAALQTQSELLIVYDIRCYCERVVSQHLGIVGNVTRRSSVRLLSNLDHTRVDPDNLGETLLQLRLDSDSIGYYFFGI